MRAAAYKETWLCVQSTCLQTEGEINISEQLEKVNFFRVSSSAEKKGIGNDKDCWRRRQMDCKWFDEYEWHEMGL